MSADLVKEHRRRHSSSALLSRDVQSLGSYEHLRISLKEGRIASPAASLLVCFLAFLFLRLLFLPPPPPPPPPIIPPSSTLALLGHGHGHHQSTLSLLTPCSARRSLDRAELMIFRRRALGAEKWILRETRRDDDTMADNERLCWWGVGRRS